MRLNRHRGRGVLALGLILLFYMPISLSALDMSGEFSVLYQEHFDTTIHNATDFQIQAAGFSVASRVGTLYITRSSTNHAMYGLRLARSGQWGNGNEYTLDSSMTINYQDKFGAQLIAKITRGNKTPVVRTINWGSGQDPLIDLGTLLEPSDFPITVNFYLGIRNIDNAQQAQGAQFQFQGVGGHNLGDFRIVSRRKNPNNSWEYFDEILPTNGSTDSLSFYSYNYNKKSIYYINGVAQGEQVFANLSIEEVLAGGQFDLMYGVGLNKKVQIAQARITLSGSQSVGTYGVKVTFLDGNVSLDSSFLLKHEVADSYIPFSLYLGGSPVHNNEETAWENLQFGDQNIKALEVGNILLSDVENKVSGLYRDTITVMITPLDTNLSVQ